MKEKIAGLIDLFLFVLVLLVKYGFQVIVERVVSIKCTFSRDFLEVREREG